MKRMLAWILVLVMLCSGAALAESGSYARMAPGPEPDSVISVVITPETYPLIRLGVSFDTDIIKGRKPPMYVTLNPREDAYPVFIENREVSYCIIHDSRSYTRITYSLSNKTLKDFLKGVKKNDIILNTEEAAAYLTQYRAFGCIPLSGLDENLSLMIEVYSDRIEEIISEEMNRILSSPPQIVTESSYWTEGRFSGVKFIDGSDTDYMLRLDFPSLRELGEYAMHDGFILTGFSDISGVEGYYLLDDNNTISARFKLSSFDTVKGSTGKTLSVTAKNGGKWSVALDGLDKSSAKYAMFRASKALPRNQLGMDAYLAVDIQYFSKGWSEDRVSQIIELLDEKYTVLNAQDDPYIPSLPEEPEAVQAEEEHSSDNSWKCASCGLEGNTGNFCPECGAAKPLPAEWTCPNCGAEGNTNNFCPNCGTKRP